MTDAAVLERPETEDLGFPNKFIYPEFAGFAGEKRLYDIVEAILPLGLRRTWEIFERKHAYDNDCFQSLGTVARTARRTQRTVNRNIATFLARGLLVLRSEYKVFRREDGSTYTKAVVVKDFSGLYALAHEYYEWQDAENYLAPEYEYVEHIRHNSHLEAKLCRFEDYRRLLEHHRDPFAQVQEDRRFTEYQPDATSQSEEQAKDAEMNQPDSIETKMLPKNVSKGASEVSQNRFNEKDKTKNPSGDSFDSGPDLGEGGRTPPTVRAYSQTRARGARGYMKAERKNAGSPTSPNESQTNPVPLCSQDMPPATCKTSESEEEHVYVQNTRQAMVAAGVVPERAARDQAQQVLPPPPKSALARSFIHEIAGIFGDLNEKGSKTGIERNIEAFELEPADVLLCLVRAYVVARDTKVEKIRYRRPDGVPNRMPLFCSMFKKFAQALGPGSRWQYTWEKMVEDIEADERLNLWVLEHQAELTGDGSERTESDAGDGVLAADPQGEAPASPGGWTDRAEALAHGERLLQAIVDANYTGIAVKLRAIADRYYVIYQVVGYEDGELVLSDEASIDGLIDQAEQGRL